MTANQDRARVIEIGEAHFASEVLRSRQPVLVAFGASWSRPCHVIDSVLHEVATACAGSLKVVKINADDNPEISMWYDIQSIPTLLYFVAGNLRAKLVGTASKQAILAKMQAASNGGDAKSLAPSRDKEHEHDEL